MKALMSSVILLTFCLAFTGCNTWSGLGKDMQKVGQKVEQQGDKVNR
jgi:predicted small secreted protein